MSGLIMMTVGVFAVCMFLIGIFGEEASQKMPLVVGLIISGLGTLSGYGMSKVASNLSYKQAMLDRPSRPQGLLGDQSAPMPPIERLGARRGERP